MSDFLAFFIGLAIYLCMEVVVYLRKPMKTDNKKESEYGRFVRRHHMEAKTKRSRR
jgi:hypothetical protein